jgi:hypothetical protein
MAFLPIKGGELPELLNKMSTVNGTDSISILQPETMTPEEAPVAPRTVTFLPTVKL